MSIPPASCRPPSGQPPSITRAVLMLRLGAVALLAAALGAMIGLLTVPGARDLLLPKVAAPASIGGPFSLVDHTGRTVSHADFRGRFMVLTFGFTMSPDMAPALLQLMGAALDRLGPSADRIVPVFVTLDPERDGQAVLAEWVARFHPRLVGLTGSPEAVAAMAAAWRMPYRKLAEPNAPLGYVLEHAALIYLMGPEGSYVAHYGPSISVQELERGLRRELSGR